MDRVDRPQQLGGIKKFDDVWSLDFKTDSSIFRSCIHNRGMPAGRGILPPIEANFFGGLTPGGKI